MFISQKNSFPLSFTAVYVAFAVVVATGFLMLAVAPGFVHAQTGASTDTSTTYSQTTVTPSTNPTVTNPVVPNTTTDTIVGLPATGGDTSVTVNDGYAGLSRDAWIALGIVAIAVVLIVVGWGMGNGREVTGTRF